MGLFVELSGVILDNAPILSDSVDNQKIWKKENDSSTTVIDYLG